MGKDQEHMRINRRIEAQKYYYVTAYLGVYPKHKLGEHADFAHICICELERRRAVEMDKN